MFWLLKIKYWKMLGTYDMHIKGRMGGKVVELPQAVEKGEIIGFNSTFFGSDRK